MSFRFPWSERPVDVGAIGAEAAFFLALTRVLATQEPVELQISGAKGETTLSFVARRGELDEKSRSRMVVLRSAQALVTRARITDVCEPLHSLLRHAAAFKIADALLSSDVIHDVECEMLQGEEAPPLGQPMSVPLVTQVVMSGLVFVAAGLVRGTLAVHPQKKGKLHLSVPFVEPPFLFISEKYQSSVRQQKELRARIEQAVDLRLQQVSGVASRSYVGTLVY